MTGERAATRELEIQQLHRWCMLFVDLLRTIGMDPAQAAEYAQVIDSAASQRDLAGMREVAKDFRQWLRDFPTPIQVAFERKVLHVTGTDLVAERREELAMIDELLARGTLSTENEYRLVLERVDEIHADHDRASEVERLNRLLSTYAV